MQNWHNYSLADELGEHDGGGGEDDFEPLFEEQTEETHLNPGDNPPGEKAPASSAIDYNRMAEAFAKAIPQPAQAPAPQQKDLTPEEFDKLTKKFVPDETVAKAFFGEQATPAQIEALKAFTNGIYQHFYASTGMLLKNELGTLEQRLTPFEAHLAEQRTKAFTDELVSRAPALKKHKNLVAGAIQTLKASNWQPQGLTESDQKLEAMRTVAKMVESHVKQFDPQFSVSASGGRGRMPQQAAMSGGGSGGGSYGGSAPKKAWQTVFGT